MLPVQVQNTGASSRDRRMNPTKTVYMVYYRATDGSGYKWSDEALTRDLGKDIVEAGETVERRILSIPSDGTYITVEPEQTAGSYTEGLRGKYTRIVGLSTLYILFYLIVLILVKLVSRLRKNWAANQEVERAAAPRNVSAGFTPESNCACSSWRRCSFWPWFRGWEAATLWTWTTAGTETLGFVTNWACALISRWAA